MAQPTTGTARPKPVDSGKRADPAPAKPASSKQPVDPPQDVSEAVTGLDMVLVDAAQGPLRRLVPPAGTALRFGSALARRPGTVASRAGELARELARVAAGRSELAPG
jgi:polyhydroxyalkanoate synthase